jgi:hypothetical protein
MTKTELIQAMKGLPDNAVVVFTHASLFHWYTPTKVQYDVESETIDLLHPVGFRQASEGEQA